MAAGAWKDWAEGELVTEALFQDIQDSIAFIYSSESAANSALTNKVEGTQFYDTGEDLLKIWDGSSAWVAVGSTKVKQIVFVTGDKTGDETTTSTANIVTSLTGSITPTSSSNKIMIHAATFCSVVETTGAGSSRRMKKGLNRDNSASEGSTANGTQVATYELGRNLVAGSGSGATHFLSETITYVDSPATTSSTSYTFTFSVESSGQTATYQNASGDTNSLIIMEIETV